MLKSIFSFGAVMLIVWVFSGCRNETPVSMDGDELFKPGNNKGFTYTLEPTTSYPDAYGEITIKGGGTGLYNFSLKAYNLEPGVVYYLDAAVLPAPVVDPYNITTEPDATANSGGELSMRGKIQLRAGETLFLFRLVNGTFSKVLQADKVLF